METAGPPNAAAWRAFLVTHASVLRTLEREMLEEQGLPLTWYDILVHLDEAPEGRLRMQTLADSILLSRSGLTRLFDRMEQRGLVRRESCPEDRRGTYAVMTPKGRSAFSRAQPGHLRGIDEHFLRHLDQDELELLERIQTKVLSSVKGAAR